MTFIYDECCKGTAARIVGKYSSLARAREWVFNPRDIKHVRWSGLTVIKMSTLSAKESQAKTAVPLT